MTSWSVTASLPVKTKSENEAPIGVFSVLGVSVVYSDDLIFVLRRFIIYRLNDPGRIESNASDPPAAFAHFMHHVITWTCMCVTNDDGSACVNFRLLGPPVLFCVSSCLLIETCEVEKVEVLASEEAEITVIREIALKCECVCLAAVCWTL